MHLSRNIFLEVSNLFLNFFLAFCKFMLQFTFHWYPTISLSLQDSVMFGVFPAAATESFLLSPGFHVSNA